jgi:hypothetical protein
MFDYKLLFSQHSCHTRYIHRDLLPTYCYVPHLGLLRYLWQYPKERDFLPVRQTYLDLPNWRIPRDVGRIENIFCLMNRPLLSVFLTLWITAINKCILTLSVVGFCLSTFGGGTFQRLKRRESTHTPGLPDGLFSNQKSQFG